MEPIWEIVSGVVMTVVGGLVGWLFGRKKYNAEVEGTRVQNFDAAIEAYKKMYEDMIADLKDQNTSLKEEVESLKQELSENRKQIITLTNFVLASALQKGEGNKEGYQALKDIIE